MFTNVLVYIIITFYQEYSLMIWITCSHNLNQLNLHMVTVPHKMVS